MSDTRQPSAGEPITPEYIQDLRNRGAVRIADALERRQRTCHHNWYRSVTAPPDICLNCGAEEDHG